MASSALTARTLGEAVSGSPRASEMRLSCTAGGGTLAQKDDSASSWGRVTHWST